MERMMEIFAHYGKNGRNVIFSYFRVQRAYVILSSEKLASSIHKTVFSNQKKQNYEQEEKKTSIRVERVVFDVDANG